MYELQHNFLLYMQIKIETTDIFKARLQIRDYLYKITDKQFMHVHWTQVFAIAYNVSVSNFALPYLYACNVSVC